MTIIKRVILDSIYQSLMMGVMDLMDTLFQYRTATLRFRTVRYQSLIWKKSIFIYHIPHTYLRKYVEYRINRFF